MKTVDFSETIAASDLKVSRSRHLIECMKICEYWGSRSFVRMIKYRNLSFSSTSSLRNKQ